MGITKQWLVAPILDPHTHIVAYLHGNWLRMIRIPQLTVGDWKCNTNLIGRGENPHYAPRLDARAHIQVGGIESKCDIGIAECLPVNVVQLQVQWIRISGTIVVLAILFGLA